MYFILTAIAAIVSTSIWLFLSAEKRKKLSTLCLIYWGATLMWLVDHCFAFIQEGGEFFDLSSSATMLGVLVVAFGLLAWAVLLLVNKHKEKRCKA